MTYIIFFDNIRKNKAEGSLCKRGVIYALYSSDNRPEFQRMIKDSAKKGFDVVIVWKLDRFARNRFDQSCVKEKRCLRSAEK